MKSELSWDTLALAPERSTMSTAPEEPTGRAAAPASQPGSKFRSCWSCRLVSGGGLILAGAYVFMEARNVMRRCGTTSMGTVAQITFAASLAAWGIVIIADPVGKAQRKDVGTPST
ncbi:distal membrane-arm assembly complex protein 1 isoform X1 [Hippoglossus stenolepis]|uniref:distal membrane-arm assembly complex protein 1-like isoform X1 n=2 Tax=Hippoglossus TaxID=8266 RepID=UPI00159C684B|nr:distal membrane-arm assembly complex protein 1-like isoform X1 [Hippoglossus stenolepis]XP_035039522.1 distal membrane-arm assembly complex protein 1 isoform X1 [Hippoglossus stenolepis]